MDVDVVVVVVGVVAGDVEFVRKGEAEDEHGDDKEEEDANGADGPERHALEARSTARASSLATPSYQVGGIGRE